MKRTTCILLLIIIALGCKKPYNPPAVGKTPTILVVEGAINIGSDPADIAYIRLSRTISTTSKPGTLSAVTGATAIIESDNGNSITLNGGDSGIYYYQSLGLDPSHKYRLRLKTTDSTGAYDEYLSDFVPVSITPPIDSVGYTVKSDGLQIYVNTHDPNNSTRYYRWDYEETWQFHSQYYSAFYSNGVGIVPRSPQQQIYNCFSNETSTSIVLGSSAKLQSDLIYQNPVTFIPSTSEKIESKYSIMMHQYALTSDAFRFWSNLKKNTEQLGSIFDPQPSNSSSNVHSLTHPAETVIGYLSVCTVQSKRVFISNSKLPSSWVPVYPYQCTQDTFLFADKSGQDATRALIPLPPIEIPTSQILVNGLATGYLASHAECVDCTLRGFTGTPDFWR